ncbi:MAG: heme-binding protein [Verrucomicrobiota bacterium]
MKNLFVRTSLALLLCAAAQAEEMIVTQARLTLAGAKAVAEAAATYARQHGAQGAIAVVDQTGQLLYFIRLENTFTGSSEIAIGKAKTAALFQKPTRVFEEAINKGRIAMTTLPANFVLLQGGVPIEHGEHAVGAIGVSGANSAAQDEEIAKAGATALAEAAGHSTANAR